MLAISRLRLSMSSCVVSFHMPPVSGLCIGDMDEFGTDEVFGRDRFLAGTTDNTAFSSDASRRVLSVRVVVESPAVIVQQLMVC
jgi:hypothetical protein